MSAERIVRLVRLLAGSSSTSNKLAATLKVSTRTVARDIQMMQAAGIPIHTLPGRDGGVILRLPREAEEASGDVPEALSQLLKEIAADAGLTARDAADRIGSFFRSSEMPVDDLVRVFGEVRHLMTGRLSAHMNYINDQGRVQRWRLRPEVLVWHDDTWTLLASTYSVGVDACVPLNRILEIDPQSVRALQTPVLPRRSPSRQVRFRIPMSAASGIMTMFTRDRLHPQDDGSIEIRLVTLRDLLCLALLYSVHVPIEAVGEADLCRRALHEIAHIFQFTKGIWDMYPPYPEEQSSLE